MSDRRFGPPTSREHRCDACGRATLETFADIGHVPVLCGVHWADADEAAASPAGSIVLARCPNCAYVRNVDFDPALMVYDTSMDTNLHFSQAFQTFSAELAEHLAERYELAGARVLDIGCGQGEFLRELCHTGGCTGVGYDAMYAGAEGPDPSGATFHSAHAPRGADCGEFDLVTSRHWFEHLDDPFEFLRDLRQHAGGRTRLRLHRGARRRLRPRDGGLGGHLSACLLLRRLPAVDDRRAGRLARRGQRHAFRRDVPLHRVLRERRRPAPRDEPAPRPGRPRPSARGHRGVQRAPPRRTRRLA